MTGAYLGITSLIVTVASAALWLQAIRRLQIPKNRGPYVVAWLAAAVLAMAALLGEPGWLGGVAAGVSLLASALLLLTVAISRQRVGDQAIQVGAAVPDFTATDEHGRTFDSRSLAGTPALIKFFRGHW